ncbi:MAG: glycosyltransferase family 2 protein [Candidatus Tyrphobacter sp.]
MATSVRRIESFTVVVPSYNEAATLRTNTEAIRAYLDARTPAHDALWTILIVDDASSDETPEIAAELAREDRRIRVIRRTANGGVDAAIRSGIEAVQSDAVVVLDADLSYRAPIVGALLEALSAEEAEVVVASAYAPGGEVRNVPRRRVVLSRWANRFLAYAARERVHTLTCIVRAYRTDALRSLLAYRPDGDAAHVMLLAALRLGMRVHEIPARLEWAPERRSRMSLSAVLRRTASVMGAALRERPSLALTIPGFVPGVLPLAVALCLLVHATPRQVGIVASATFAVQTASLFVFGFHSGNFALRTLLTRRSASRGVVRENT